jgi:acetyl-CoA C-acetyltransferase
MNQSSAIQVGNRWEDMNQPVILSGCRTPIGTLLGDLSTIPAPELGAIAVRGALRRCDLEPDQVDEVIIGNVLPAGMGGAPARQVGIKAGITVESSALTVNKMCGSGLKAVMLAAQGIAVGDNEVIVAGGIESMSRAPYLVVDARRGWKFGNQELIDSMLSDGLVCPFVERHVGHQADYIARVKSVSREDQDRFALESQRRAVAAIESGAFKEEIEPVEVPARNLARMVSVDQGPRPDTTLEKLGRLKPVFEENGTVTPGNASQIADGAAALVVTSRRYAQANGKRPMARIVAQASNGVEPKDVFVAPVLAINKVLKRAGLSVDDIDLFELNEAFAAQMIACIRPLDLPLEKLNVHGGSIALGHPIGASGARVLVTLLHAMRLRGAKRGLVSFCLGGGGAVAMIIEAEE